MKANYLLLVLGAVLILNCKQQKKETVDIKEPALIEKESKQYIYGIDISDHQNNLIDSINKQKDSLGFIICKATEGITYTDPNFLYNWKTIKEKSFLRGAYHFYRSNDDPIAQAQNFLNAISSIETTDIPPVIDFEDSGIDASKSIESIQSDLKVFINEIETKLKCKPIIYTDNNIGNKYLNEVFFADYPLWIASYDGKETPDLPNAWKEKGWLVWQKSSDYKIDGTTSDFDVYNGSLQDFKDFIKNSYQKE